MSVENAGPFAPTGSRYKWNCNKINCKHSLTHRNIGTGNPCAGHKRAKPWPSDRKKELLLSSVENIGLLAPIGSVLEQRFLIRLVNFQTSPEQFILLKPVCWEIVKEIEMSKKYNNNGEYQSDPRLCSCLHYILWSRFFILR